MEKLYSYSTSRNKFPMKKKLPNYLKNQLFSEKEGLCYICKEKFELRKLEFEHKVPVILGGHLFDKENVDLICQKCHQQKSLADRKVIKLMRDLKMIWGNYPMYSFYPLHKLKEFYILFFGLWKDSSNFHKIWVEGNSGEDYKEIIQTENRAEITKETFEKNL
jgi:hypothetical protein